MLYFAPSLGRQTFSAAGITRTLYGLSGNQFGNQTLGIENDHYTWVDHVLIKYVQWLVLPNQNGRGPRFQESDCVIDHDRGVVRLEKLKVFRRHSRNIKRQLLVLFDLATFNSANSPLQLEPCTALPIPLCVFQFYWNSYRIRLLKNMR